jgi:hypothetical protein
MCRKWKGNKFAAIFHSAITQIVEIKKYTCTHTLISESYHT